MKRSWAFVAFLFTAFPAAASELVELSAAQMQGLQLKFAAAAGVDSHLIATLPAVIAPPPNARVAVVATFPGIVLQTLTAEGDAVRRGQSLAVIASREVLSLTAELAGAQARLAAAEANAKRQMALAAEGIVAGARVEEASAAFAQMRAEVGAKARVLKSVAADAGAGTYTLSAPIDGTVVSAKLEAGAAVDGVTAAFVVDAIDRYEVQAQVPERLIGMITPGMRVLADGKVEATVTSVGKALRPETRSATLKAKITNATGLIAGRNTTAAIYAPAGAGAMRVPRAAVTELAGESVVFVRTAGGVTVRKVTTAPVAGEDVVVLEGLVAGENVAVSNLSELKSLALVK